MYENEFMFFYSCDQLLSLKNYSRFIFCVHKKESQLHIIILSAHCLSIFFTDIVLILVSCIHSTNMNLTFRQKRFSILFNIKPLFHNKFLPFNVTQRLKLAAAFSSVFHNELLLQVFPWTRTTRWKEATRWPVP